MDTCITVKPQHSTTKHCEHTVICGQSNYCIKTNFCSQTWMLSEGWCCMGVGAGTLC